MPEMKNIVESWREYVNEQEEEEPDEEQVSSSEIENTLKLSEQSKIIWKNTSLDERKKLVSKFVEYFLLNNKEIEEELCKQMGRPLSQ